MIISKDEQEQTDFDWFAVDSDGHLGHFTTAGFKYLPASISSNAQDLERVTDYFETDAPVKCGHRIDSEVLKEKQGWKGEEHEGRYLESFVSMADKGLFSFDIDTYVCAGLSYFRVAMPLSPITLNELPEDVQRIVGRTVLRGISFESVSRVDYQATLVA